MLRDKALIVSVKKSRWGATRQNPAATEEYLNIKGAKDGSGRWVDTLIDTKHPAYMAVTAAYNDIDKFHKGLTMPWDDKLRRLLPSRLYPEHTAGMKQRIKAVDKAVSKLAAEFPGMVEYMRQVRGPMFNAEDYPSVSELIDKHSIVVEVDPMPNIDGDFRATLTDSDLRAAEERAAQKFESAMLDIWNQAAELISKVSDRLGDQDKIFRDSLINNLREFARKLPEFNITGNPDLEEITRRINEELLAHEPKQLRDDPGARKKTAESADDILAKMAGYTGMQKEKEAA